LSPCESRPAPIGGSKFKEEGSMQLKHITLALATTALVGLGTALIAQDKTGTNVSKDAAVAMELSATEKVSLAQKLYQTGGSSGDAVLVAVAGKLMLSVEMKDVERESAQAPIEGADTAETGEGVDAPVSGADMLAKAKELAAGDDAMLAMIDDIEAEGGRGRIGGASRTLSRLPAGYNDTFRIPYYGGVLAELAVVGDGDADLDLLVTDENGNTICYDTSYSDQLYCSWSPRWDGNFFVTVKNMGRVRNSYYLLTT
jgi:hypothetical protein